MGLPSAGKTTLAKELIDQLINKGKTVKWFNADQVRKENDDWDFSDKGRLRQAARMFQLSKDVTSDFVVCDFVCPTPLLRLIYAPDFTIWVDTIKASEFDDTNDIFTPPTHFDFRVVQKNAEHYAALIVDLIIDHKGNNEIL